MTASDVAVARPTAMRRSPSVPGAIARLEARRHLRNPVLWLGIAASAYAAWRSRSIEWTAGPYSAFPVDLVPAAWSLLVLGAVAGGRDHLPGLRPAPTVATATGGDRLTAARLLGLLAPLAVVSALVAGMVVVARLTGGYRIGERGWSVDDAQLSIPEIAQPILLAALCGAFGVAAGRAVRHTLVVVAGGTLVLFALGLIAWAWQWAPAVYVTPVQLQPFSVALDRPGPGSAPADWWLSAPGPHQDGWRRLVVDPVVAAGHDLVLLGATAACVGWAVRGAIGRSTVVTGVALAAGGVVIQVGAAPW